jgi:hypothetical protein
MKNWSILLCPSRLSEYGFSKVKDLLVYEADTGKGYKTPERCISFSRRMLEQKPNFTVRRLRKKDLEKEAEYILHILNTAVSGNWGYVPI